MGKKKKEQLDELNDEFGGGEEGGGTYVPPQFTVDPVGVMYYGKNFRHFENISTLKHLYPAFKEFYFKKMRENKEARIIDITNEFQSEIHPETFFPYPRVLASWKKRWDEQIAKYPDKALIAGAQEEQNQLITMTQNDKRIVPSDIAVEQATRQLAGELVNDATQMLKEDQEFGHPDEELLVKRRMYIVNVLGHVTKMVQGKAKLMLEASKEKRENANFLMDLIDRATAGQLTEADVADLNNITHNQNERAQPTEVS